MTESGDVLIAAGKMNRVEDVRLIVREDTSVQNISAKDAMMLKDIEDKASIYEK